MEQMLIKQSKAIGLLIFAIIASGAAFMMAFGYGWGCGLGMDRLECAIVPKTLGIFSTINIIFIVFLIALAIKPFLTIKTFKILLAVYLVFVAIVGFISFSFQKGGILYSMIKGTEIECKLFLDYTTRSYCYRDLAKSTDNITYCKNTEISSGCFKYFAEKSGDVSLCPKEDSYCIMGVAEKIKDPALCEQITSSYTRPQCFAILAGITGDLSLCKKSNSSFVSCQSYEKKFYNAKSINFEFIPLTKVLVNKGEKEAELAKIKITVAGGDASLGSISFTDNTLNVVNKPKIKNINLYDGSKLLTSDVRSTFLDNQYYSAAMQYDFQFGSDSFVISNNKPLILTVKGDVWNEEGVVRFKQGGFSGYPDAIHANSSGVGSLSTQINIQ